MRNNFTCSISVQSARSVGFISYASIEYSTQTKTDSKRLLKNFVFSLTGNGLVTEVSCAARWPCGLSLFLWGNIVLSITLHEKSALATLKGLDRSKLRQSPGDTRGRRNDDRSFPRFTYLFWIALPRGGAGGWGEPIRAAIPYNLYR